MNKILFVISSLEAYGGMERVASMIANMFSDYGYDVSIITRDSHSVKPAFSLSNKVKVINIPGSLPMFLDKIKSYVKLNRIDFVISHNMGRMTLALLLINFKRTHCQFITFEHVAYVSNPLWVRLLKRVAYSRVYKVVVLSEGDANNYKSFHQKVFAVFNPTSFRLKDPVHYKVESNTIISLGRLTYQKGYDLLINSWSIIESKYPNWSVEIYGVGEDLEKLETLKNKLSLKRIFLKGLATNSRDIYNRASFYVMSSRFEGLPMVLIEAQTFGLPIVSFNCPYGPSDIIDDGVNGFLVESGNVVGLSKSIEELILDEELRKQFSEQSLGSAQRFSSDNVLKQWIKVLNNI